MGIYIKNMKMPKTCAKCPFFEPYSIACFITHYFLDRDDYRFGRDKDCPLVEILTPHGRLIDVDALQCKVDDIGLGYYAVYGVTEDTIDSAPTIIEAEENGDEE